jgi:hypothetical protein
MVKMIRLASTDPSLSFQNNYQSNIVIEPNSKIALYNCNFEKDSNTLVINAENQTVILDITVNGEELSIYVNLSTGVYNIDNYEDIYNQIMNALKLQYYSLDNGGQLYNEWQMGLKISLYNANDRFNISVNRVPITSFGYALISPYPYLVNSYNMDFSLDGDVFATTPANISYVTTNGDWTFPNQVLSTTIAQLKSPQPTRGGCWIFSQEIKALDATSIGGVMGLTDTVQYHILSTNRTNGLDQDYYSYSIAWTNTNLPYVIDFIDSTGIHVTANSPVNATVNDVIVWRTIYNNNPADPKPIIQLILYTAIGPTTYVLINIRPDVFIAENPLIPYITLAPDPGGTPCELSQVKFCGDLDDDKYIYSNLTRSNIEPTDAGIFPLARSSMGRQTSLPATISFTFDNSLARFLGFENNTMTVTNIQSAIITSEKPVQLYDTSEAYVIELFNIPVNFYDGYLEQRKNVCMLFQNIRNRSETDVYFQTSSPIYLDINNLETLNIRTLQGRILNSNYQQIKSKKLSNIVLLIKGPNE